MELTKTYYISQGNNVEEHLANIKGVLEAGCKLVQLRIKGLSDELVLSAAERALKLCNAHDALLIVNDNVEVAKLAGTHGVHLGKEDMGPLKARGILKEGAIVGGTANNLDDCLELLKENVDYIGLGPFRFTTTKKNLSPTLSLSDYTEIVQAVERQNPHVPIYAIGGIVKEDVEYIYETGVYGVAISSALSTGNMVQLAELVDHCENLEVPNF